MSTDTFGNGYYDQCDRTRRYTRRLIELVNEGLFSAEEVVLAALHAMSEDEVKHMCKANDYQIFADDDEEDDITSDPRCHHDNDNDPDGPRQQG